MALAAATGGELRIRDAEPADLAHDPPRSSSGVGLQTEIDGTDLLVPPGQELHIQDDLGDAIPKIEDGPWPAFPADLTSIALALATQADGTILIFEKMFENRLFFVDKLVAMGARITLCDPHRAIVSGPSRLHGERVESPDIRAGMAMLIAALAAEGTLRDRQHPADRPRLRGDRRAPARPRRADRAGRGRPRAAPWTLRGAGHDPSDPPGTQRHPARRDARAARAPGRLAEVFESFGYGEVATPTIEYDEVLARGRRRASPRRTASSTLRATLLAHARGHDRADRARSSRTATPRPSRRSASSTSPAPTAPCAPSAARWASSSRPGSSWSAPGAGGHRRGRRGAERRARRRRPRAAP